MMADPAPPQYMRVNVLIAIAIASVILCVFVVVQYQVTNEYAKGILTLVLGRFLGYVDNIYNFEFGTTRASTKKDETINALTTTASTTATTAQVVALNPLTASAPPSGPIQAENVKVDAQTVTVDQQPKGTP